MPVAWPVRSVLAGAAGTVTMTLAHAGERWLRRSCTGSGQSIAFVGGTSAAAPVVAGMIALRNQQAHNQGLPRPGFVPPLLTSLAQHDPQTFLDTGWGSPMANVVASKLRR
jgi:hypothetical protein